MELNEKFGHIVRTLRQNKNWSQEYFAGIAEIDRTYLQSIEKGKRNITIKTLEKISKALEIKMSDLIKKIENEL